MGLYLRTKRSHGLTPKSAARNQIQNPIESKILLSKALDSFKRPGWFHVGWIFSLGHKKSSRKSWFWGIFHCSKIPNFSINLRNWKINHFVHLITRFWLNYSAFQKTLSDIGAFPLSHEFIGLSSFFSYANFNSLVRDLFLLNYSWFLQTSNSSLLFPYLLELLRMFRFFRSWAIYFS